MNNLEPIKQTKLYGLGVYLNELIRLYKKNIYPNKILLSGQKGIGKSTLAFHFINYVLTLNENFKYDTQNFNINIESSEFKTIQNKSNTNLISIDVNTENKTIDINQIRQLIIKLNKSSFNQKPRFVLIDNIELLNINSTNALLKVLEEPNENINFILIHNNKKIPSTLLSRCINFKISLKNSDYLKISNQLLNDDLENLISKDLINYYFTPGEIYHLVQFSIQNKYDLSNIDLKSFLKILIKEEHYKKNNFINQMMYNLIELYFRGLNSSFSNLINEKYSYFVKRISDTKTYNLDKESLFMEFNEEILNG
jgi:DNA polymerase-3 subunit delta'|tara:strand:+ start:419 stop:1351 length:933 start_codon:yes stop_codon:yes gene_type:complete